MPTKASRKECSCGNQAVKEITLTTSEVKRKVCIHCYKFYKNKVKQVSTERDLIPERRA